jgi:signal transduction histidine kinase
MLDAAGTHLKTGAAPSLPEAMNRAIDGQAIGPQAGSCGTAAYRREPVFVDDIEHDPLWARYKELALPFGFHACWSHPLLANDGHVLGTFALYYRDKRLPDDETLQIIRRTAHVVGMAIERRALDDQLRALNERMDAAREDERTGIAREIHDQLGQALTALKLDIAWLARRSGSGDGEAMREKLAEMSKNSDEILQSVRRISSELRPGVLDDLGLEAAIEWQAEDFHKRTGTPIEVRARLGDVRLDRHLATSAFRIFQEALTNVTRHAGASRVEVDLHLDKGQLVLEVADDGVGLPTDLRGGSLGLLGMRERARRLGGDCLVARRDPRGTLVTLRLPLRFPADT